MKSGIRFFLIVAFVAVLTACTPRIYGVPQEQWEVMSENERIAAMDAYKERQIAYQRAAAERARIRAEREAARQARLEAELQRRHERADLIYRGRAGTFGDLIEVTLHHGQMRLNYKKRHYSPVTFKLADGEIKSIPIHFSKGRQAELWVLYENRHLWLDIDPYKLDTRRGAYLVYNDDWASGVTYTGINSHGSRDLRGINVDIDVVPLRRSRNYAVPKPVVIVREKVVQLPPRVIVREKIVEKPVKVERSKDHPVSRDNHVNNENKRRSRDDRKRSDQDDVDRVRVELNGGKILIDGQYRPFRPITFTLTEGRASTIVLTGKGRKNDPFRQEVQAIYRNGRVVLDGQSLGAEARQKRFANRKKVKNSKGDEVLFRDVKFEINRNK